MPYDLKCTDAPSHRRVAHVAAQCHAAGHPALAHAGGDQRLRHRAGGKHGPACTNGTCRGAGAHHRADHAPALLDRRFEARRRIPARTGSQCAASQDVVEDAPRQHGQRAWNVNATAAGPDTRDMVCRLGKRHHLVEHPQPAQRGQRVGDQAVAADLLARELVLIHEQDVAPGARQRLRTRAAGWTAADHQHVACVHGIFSGLHRSRTC
jgi:hypothetical protein